MNKKEPRRELAATQVDTVRTVLTQLFPYGADGIGTHPAELLEISTALRAASDLLYRAAEKHQGREPSWKQFCEALMLPPAVSQVQRVQGVLEPLVSMVGVELVRGSGRKGDALPGFRVVSDAGREPTLGGCASYQSAAPEKRRPHYMKAEEFDKKFDDGEEDITGLLDLSKTRRPAPAIEPEDLTALDGEPDNRSECDRCAAEINTDNEGVILDGQLLCAKCHADDQLSSCCGCGGRGELSPDADGDLVCKDCLLAAQGSC